MTSSSRWVWAAFLLGLAGTAAAQEMNPFGAHKGELARMQPPDWLKEGTRLQWESAGSSMPVTTKEGTVTSAGAGILTLDVVSLVGTTAAVAARTQVRTAGAFGGEALSAPRAQGIVLEGAAWGNEMWVHPAILLKTFQSLAVGGPWTAFRGPYEIDGRKIPAIQFVAGGGPQDLSRTSLVYEEKTGILLFSASSQRAHAGGTLHPIATNRFLGVRDRKLPWAMGRPPKWLATLVAYRYTGNLVAEIPGVPPMPLPISALFTRERVGQNFIVAKMKIEQQTAGVPQVPTETLLVSGPTQVGGLWMPPIELKKLRQGQVCDVDKITGEKVYVQYVGPTPYGRRVAVIMEEAAGYTSCMEYELDTGILLVFTIRDKLLGTATQIAFTAKQRGVAGAEGD